MSQVSVGRNKDCGETVETTLADIYQNSQPEETTTFDLYTQDERPAEVKTCLTILKSGRHGRIWISKQPHFLLQHDGEHFILSSTETPT